MELQWESDVQVKFVKHERVALEQVGLPTKNYASEQVL